MQTLILILVGLVAAIAGAGWAGLRVRPRPFPPYPERTPPFDLVPLPTNLPPPVARFFRTILGEQIPVIESAVLTGSVRIRIAGLRFPGRFRITHVAGESYRHYIEATIFGYPVMKVNEHYLDGKSRLELPFGVVENEPKVDMAANLGLWAESFWLPSILVTHPRVRWEAIDDSTARLVVPFESGEDSFAVAFDAQTGLMRATEAMRYKDAKAEAKVLWRSEPLGWKLFHGIKIPSPAALTWLDEGTPWAVWTIEDVAYNVDVSAYIRARGL